METPDDIENRLSGADRDVSEVRSALRAHTSPLNALRETQVELHQAQLEMGRLDTLETTMTQGFATLGTGLTQILSLLEQREA